MPEHNGLAGTEIDTGNLFQDCLDNIVQLVNEHRDQLAVPVDGGGAATLELPVTNIVNYDEIRVPATPWLSVVFDTSRVIHETINKCMIIEMDVSLYFYFCSLNFGIDTHPFLAPLYRLMEMFIVHYDLYNFTNGTPRGIGITNCSLVGRRLDPDVFLTGQLNLSVPVRGCFDDHATAPTP